MKLPVLFLLLLLLQAVLVICNTDNTKATVLIKRNAPSNRTIQGRETYLEVLRGRDGRDGLPGREGQKGERGDKGDKGDTGPIGPTGAKSGGVVYTRWGKTSCPSSTGAQLLYEGIVAGSDWNQPGGGANYVCLPKVPQYMSTALPPYFSYMYGTEYDGNVIFSGRHNHNAPCAVCYSSAKLVKLMIPARTSCPSSWTVEYKGYLMAEKSGHKKNVVYECVDENPESIPGSHPDTNGNFLNFVLSTCNGLPCPPYIYNRAITCVVCTK